MIKHKIKKHSLKIVSVFLSLFLWVYVLNAEKVKFEKTVSLEYLLPEDLVFIERPPQEVIFLIEGPRAFVRTVTEREDKLVIDLNRLNSLRKTNLQLDINPTQLSLPFGMVVERVLPRRISLRMEKKASKIVPLKLQLSGSLPEKLTLANVELRPGEVEILGPKSLINKLKRVMTKPIELESLLGHEEVPVEVQLQDERFSLGINREMKLAFQLKAASANFTIKQQPIKFLTQSKTLSSKTKAASLRLLVPEHLLKNRSNISSSVQVWADIPEGVKGQVEVPLKIVLPPGIHLLEILPKSIIVNVQ